MTTVFLNEKPIGFDSLDITIGETGKDWQPTKEIKYYAQKGAIYAFGATEIAALTLLLKSLP